MCALDVRTVDTSGLDTVGLIMETAVGLIMETVVGLITETVVGLILLVGVSGVG